MDSSFQILGRVGKMDAKALASGTKLLNVSLACTRKVRNSDDKITDWFECTVWNPSSYWDHIDVGDMILVKGDMTTRRDEESGRKYYDFTVRDQKIVTKKRSDSSGSGNYQEKSYAGAGAGTRSEYEF